ncbi:MAG: cysteine rich repeat-containing protein [Beijerinckiaceae bacterium]
MQTKSALALAILSVFLASPALSQSDLRSRQQAACEEDAYRFCPNEIPDEARVASCLTRQKSNLSPECRAMFAPPPRQRTRR